jgi:hypothetical protein
VTGALLVGSLIATAQVSSAVDDYKDAAAEYDACTTEAECDRLYDVGIQKLEDGRDKETIRDVLWVATGVAAVGTAVVALVLTDWSGDEGDDLSLRIAPDPQAGGAAAILTGRF